MQSTSRYLTSLLILLIIPNISYAVGITDLGTLNGGTSSSARGVNADGSVVVGVSEDGSVSQNRAFRTVGTQLISLGVLNAGISSQANGVSLDGRVIVGQASDGSAGNLPRAFRWTAATGLVSIGVLNGGTVSLGTAISGDSNVIVGIAFDGAMGNSKRAFRWTQATGMQSLSIFAGGFTSEAAGVNLDGTVVVGNADNNLFQTRAFRWTQATGMESLGTLNGGSVSSATGVSGDGSVVVGQADDGAVIGSPTRAFRWTVASNTMVSLGTLNGGNASSASGISSNGLVIVGTAFDGVDSQNRGFRWTQNSGMQSVEDWLRAAGVSVPQNITQDASATNIDGSVVVGTLANNQAYIARVSSANGGGGGGSGLISLPDLSNSLQSVLFVTNLELNTGQLILNGSHGHPLSSRITEGCNAVWASGDWGHFNTKHNLENQHGPVALAEIGVAHLFPYTIQAGIGIGRTEANQYLLSNGKMRSHGTYVIGEVIAELGHCLWGTLTGYYLSGDTHIHRGYFNAGVPVRSRGTTDVKIPGIRARIDWENATQICDVNLTPYGQFSVVRAKLDPYQENGGGFPAVFNGRKESAPEARLGLTGTWDVYEIQFLSSIEGVHRFNNLSAVTSGQLVGLMNFNYAGQKLRRNWLRGSFGFERELGKGTASLYLNGATPGQDPRVWVALSYRIDF